MKPLHISLASFIFSLLSLGILPSCRSTVPSFSKALEDNKIVINNSFLSKEELPNIQAPGFWDEDLQAAATGNKKIIIDKKDQRAYFYIGKQLVADSPVSTGKHSISTPTGTFSIVMKNLDHVSLNYGTIINKTTGATINNSADLRHSKIPAGCRFIPAPMPYFMRVSGPVGMHEGFLPGYPASHGCIRMPHEMAKKFFENTPVGTTVIVK